MSKELGQNSSSSSQWVAPHSSSNYSTTPRFFFGGQYQKSVHKGELHRWLTTDNLIWSAAVTSSARHFAEIMVNSETKNHFAEIEFKKNHRLNIMPTKYASTENPKCSERFWCIGSIVCQPFPCGLLSSLDHRTHTYSQTPHNYTSLFRQYAHVRHLKGKYAFIQVNYGEGFSPKKLRSDCRVD